ncbi:MAG: DNA polymerase III subunit delta [Actinomycetota bacterium]
MPSGRAPVHLVWGEDAFLLREAAAEILGDVQPVEVDAAEWQGGETSDLATPSLFGDRRALLVTDAKSLPDDGVTELKAYLRQPAPDAPLVLLAVVGERAKAPASLVKMVEPVGEVREVKVARKDLPGWVTRRAAVRSVQLAPDAAAALVGSIGEDPAALDQALVQLSTAFPDERVTADVVGRQFRGLGDQHTWDLCDRAFRKDLAGAMRSLRTLTESRADPLMILGAVAARLRDLIRMRALPERMSPSEAARTAGLRFEWQARAYRDQARRFSPGDLTEIHEQVVEADRMLKSAGADAAVVVLPMLIARIAGEPVTAGVG